MQTLTLRLHRYSPNGGNMKTNHAILAKFGNWTALREDSDSGKRFFVEHSSGVQYNKNSAAHAIESARKANQRDQQNQELGI